jgi:hypothetical protein
LAGKTEQDPVLTGTRLRGQIPAQVKPFLR